jgi:hypothetical protein
MLYVFGIPTAFTAIFGLDPTGLNQNASAITLGKSPVSLQNILTGSSGNQNLLLAMLGGGLIALIVAFAVGTGILSGFAAIYIVASFIFIFFINLLLIPLSTFGIGGPSCAITDPTCYSFIGLIWMALVNLLALSTAWEFIRGGG